MQFRAVILYAVLFVVVAGGAYGVAATASAPPVTADDVEVDHVLEEEGQEFEVDGQTFNVSSLQEDSGTVEYVNESAILEAEWSDGDAVLIEENGTEYEVTINQPGGDEGDGNESDGAEGNESEDNETDGGDEEAAESEDNATDDAGGEDGANETDDNESEGNETDGNESEGGEDAGPNSFTLIGEYDDEEIQVEELGENDQPYVITGEDGERTAVPIEEFDGIDAETFETGDSIEFYDEEAGSVIEGEVIEIGEETVTIEYEGEEVTEHELAHGEDVTLNDQEFAVYFDGETASLSSDVDALETQQDAVEEFHQRVTGLWWVIALAVMGLTVTTGLAFMPVRG